MTSTPPPSVGLMVKISLVSYLVVSSRLVFALLPRETLALGGVCAECDGCTCCWLPLLLPSIAPSPHGSHSKPLSRMECSRPIMSLRVLSWQLDCSTFNRTHAAPMSAVRFSASRFSLLSSLSPLRSEGSTFGVLLLDRLTRENKNGVPSNGCFCSVY